MSPGPSTRNAALVAVALTLALGAGIAAEPGAAAPSPASWPTYHADNARSGVDSSSPPHGAISQAWAQHLDGSIYAEPLVVGQRVYVATENNSVYALDAQSGQVLWQSSLGPPVRAGSLPCGNISPVTGITGTPVISPDGATIYAVAFRRKHRHLLFGLDTSSGAIRFSRRADAPHSKAKVQQERAALSFANGRVYIPYGGLNGDCGPYKGRVVSLDAGGGARRHFTLPRTRQAGLWAPSGAAIDGLGRVFIATGNGAAPRFDFGNSVIGLSPNLHRLGFFRPRNGGALNRSDTDVGSVGPTLLSGDRLFQIGKEGVGYVLSTDRLGGVGGALGTAAVCGPAFGGMAYQDPFVFLPCTNGLAAVRVGAGGSFSVAWRGPSFNAGPPILAGGAVWTIDIDSGTLHAFDPATGSPIARFDLGAVTHFATPSAGGGMLFAPAGDRVVAFRGI